MAQNNVTVTTTVSVERITFVRFFYSGMPLRDEDVTKVTVTRPRDIDVPRGAYAFQLFERDVLTYDVDGCKKQAHGPFENLSPKYYPGGTMFTLAYLQSRSRGIEGLIEMMEDTGARTAVETCNGEWVIVRDESQARLLPDERPKR